MASLEPHAYRPSPEWATRIAKRPGVAVLGHLIVAYAESQGGRVKEVLFHLYGIFWGEDGVISEGRCSELTGLTIDEVRSIHQAAFDAIREDLWNAPEYRDRRARGAR